MPSFFTIPDTDQSLFYLGKFFGTVGTVVNPTPGQTTFNLIGYLFKGLNTTALIIGALLVTYTTVMGLLKTAQEGEFLGKQWNSLWVPLRMVIGIASLFPTTAGYSVLQIVLMWVIVQGIGAADSLWTIVLQYVNAIGSPYASVTGAPPLATVTQDIEALYSAVSCYTAAQQSWGDTYTTSTTRNYYYCGDPNNASSTFCRQGLLSTIIEATSTKGPMCSTNNGLINCSMGPNAACGTITFTDPVSACASGATDLGSQIKCASAKAQQSALNQVLAITLEPAATDLVTFDHEYMAFMNNTNPAPTAMPPIWLQNYCTEQDIPATAAECCFIGVQPSKSANYIGWMVWNASKCQRQPDSGPNSFFPPADANVGGQTDFGNANTAAVSDILWPCGIAPILSGNPNNGACQKTTATSADFLSASVTYYNGVIAAAVGPIMDAYMANAANLSSGALSNAAVIQGQGWIMAGAYYFQIAGMNNNNLKNSVPTLQVNATNPMSGNNALSGYRNDFTAASTISSIILAQDKANSGNGPSIATTAPQVAQMVSSLGQSANGVMGVFQSMITGSSTNGVTTNPLIALQSLGEALMITAQVMYSTFLSIGFVALVLGKLNFIGLGTGATEDPIGAGIGFILTAMLGVLLSFMAWCMTTGAMLGIYTPLIPYIIFTFGALGWIIATIEAMVAAPFVALGILSPGGHDILGKSDAGLMILFNTFCRPSLMIIGMMSGMLLAPLGVTLINSTFNGVMGSIDQTPGLLELITFMTIYMTLILSVMNKCFALIYLIPDRVLSWLGHRAESSAGDSSDAVSGAKSGSEKGAGAVAGGATGSLKAGMGAGEAKGKAQVKENDAKAAAGKANVSGDDTGAGATVQGPRREDGSY